MTLRFIKTSAVRRFLLDYAKATRGHTWTRVSPEAIAQVDAAAQRAAERIVDQHPSIGKTIKP